ncbi:hypothetical protein DSO57_1030559 [Entomophthora muscae]|uniref:Uncharacterized protein n=1 Tax=Entomophthora muscae TaxID=34485 RepID=A0ACC2SQJ2_9FUNG|nr:hypothetical protein DSO57_1030559 [Entomophthora muscae]
MQSLLEAKVVILGSQGVGKSSLVLRYIQKTFSPNSPSTIGAAFSTTKILTATLLYIASSMAVKSGSKSGIPPARKGSAPWRPCIIEALALPSLYMTYPQKKALRTCIDG